MGKVTKEKLKAGAALAPLIEFVAANRGASVGITAELSRRTGRKQHPVNVREWLAEDPAKRVDCRLGVGLFLLEIAADIRAGRFDPLK